MVWTGIYGGATGGESLIEFRLRGFQVFWVYLGVLSTTHRDEARREVRNPSENLPET